MSATPHRHLVVVDQNTGEQLGDLGDQGVEGCPGCAELADVVAGLQRDIRGWTTRYRNLERDRNAEARKHAAWPKAVEAFNHWRTACNHPRSSFDPDRFWLVQPFVERHGLDLVKRAIDGAAFDPFTKPRKNGSVKRFDDWELIFRSAGKFEEFCNRAPTRPENGGDDGGDDESTQAGARDRKPDQAARSRATTPTPSGPRLFR